MGDLLDEDFYADLERDQAERATMSMLVPPQMLNTMVPSDGTQRRHATEAFYADPVRRYMLPVASDRRTDWPSPPARHPRLAPRARHVGGRGADPPLPDQGARRAAVDLPAVLRPLHPDGPGRQLHPAGRPSSSCAGKPVDRYDARCSPTSSAPRACATSWSPAGTWPTCRGSSLEAFLDRLLEIDTIRDIRLATKALIGLPQHWLQPDVVEGVGRGRAKAARRAA